LAFPLIAEITTSTKCLASRNGDLFGISLGDDLEPLDAPDLGAAAFEQHRRPVSSQLNIIDNAAAY